MKKQTNTHNLKPEFFNKLLELGVYEKWERAWRSDNPVSRIDRLNKLDSFHDFIARSFIWIGTNDGADFWVNIAES